MLKKVFVGISVISVMLFAKIEYSISAVGMSMDYNEYKDGKLLDSESSRLSDLTGVELTYNYIMKENDILDFNNIVLSIMALDGDTKYLGSYIGSNLGYGNLVSTTSNKIYDIDLDFIHTFHQTVNYKLMISLGVGYRFWRRELSVQQVEDYKWYSLRPSIALSYNYKNLNITPRFEYQYGIRPRMKASDFNQEFVLGSANIMQLSIPIKYTFNKSLSIYTAYTYQYQKIRESEIVYDSSGTGYLEPESKAYNEYIKFGIIFKY
ncbi:hypothetical protein FJR45_10260 [Sulfurimonas sediminis]|uniref:Outer membrane protein beta-barrel domain-containing protein n=1 Tax=Sulfurimonas sediminis TaxID=2590020 RepID=A0A7M1B3L2_9BACT|nr:hypothetical protein [Sulfurimonas sediminis]QOP44304.1 hypothetical protein FJR45_10260 [Sulfurimonas sediminis]